MKKDPWLNLPLLALAAVTLGTALQVRDGLYAPLAVALLAIVCALVILAMLRRQVVADRWTNTTLSFGLLIQIALLYSDFPGSHHHVHAWREFWPFLAIISVAGVATIMLIIRPRASTIALALLIGTYLAAGVWLVRFTPQPLMDVYTFQRDACEAVLHGTNPYSITYPNIYGPEGEWVYGPGLAKDGRLPFGFPYMPVTLGVELVGHVIAGDYRYSLLMCVAASAGLIVWRNLRARAVLCAGILLFTPRGFYLIEQGWSEPVVVFLLCAVVVSAKQFPRATPILFGLLVAAKQYDLFMVPLGVMLIGSRNQMPPLQAGEPAGVSGRWGESVRFFLTAFAAAAVATIPMVLWEVRAFWNSAVMLQFRQPFRMDSLSISALIAHHTGVQLGTWAALLAVAVAIIVCLRRIPWTPAGFAIAVAVSYLAFFAFSKQAFANYYFLVIAGLCIGIGRDDLLTSRAVNVR